LEEIVAAPAKKTETNDRGVRCANHATPSIRKSWHNFANKRQSLGRHSWLEDQSHGVFFLNITNRFIKTLRQVYSNQLFIERKLIVVSTDLYIYRYKIYTKLKAKAQHIKRHVSINSELNGSEKVNVSSREIVYLLKTYVNWQMLLAAVMHLTEGQIFETLLTLQMEKSPTCLVGTWRRAISIAEPLILFLKSLMRNEASRHHHLE
jgi:hypothetical protein